MALLGAGRRPSLTPSRGWRPNPQYIRGWRTRRRRTGGRDAAARVDRGRGGIDAGRSAWSRFFSVALGAAVALDGVSADLANNLRTAAGNYTQTETRNAVNLSGGR